MQFHHRVRSCGFWMLSAAALASATACADDSDADRYWQHTAHEQTQGPTTGDILGDWDMGTPKAPYSTHAWGVMADQP